MVCVCVGGGGARSCLVFSDTTSPPPGAALAHRLQMKGVEAWEEFKRNKPPHYRAFPGGEDARQRSRQAA
jgi:hypothetical protein